MTRKIEVEERGGLAITLRKSHEVWEFPVEDFTTDDGDEITYEGEAVHFDNVGGGFTVMDDELDDVIEFLIAVRERRKAINAPRQNSKT